MATEQAPFIPQGYHQYLTTAADYIDELEKLVETKRR